MPKSNPSTKATQPATPATYEAANDELQALVRQMESGQMSLDTLLVSYERGAFLLNFCRSKLEALEQQVQLIDHEQLKPWTLTHE